MHRVSRWSYGEILKAREVSQAVKLLGATQLAEMYLEISRNRERERGTHLEFLDFAIVIDVEVVEVLKS
jgi:hypothetical protein